MSYIDYGESELGDYGPCEQQVYHGGGYGSNGGYKPCGKPATVVRDPFIGEIYGEEVYRMLCDDCFSNRKDDV